MGNTNMDAFDERVALPAGDDAHMANDMFFGIADDTMYGSYM